MAADEGTLRIRLLRFSPLDWRSLAGELDPIGETESTRTAVDAPMEVSNRL